MNPKKKGIHDETLFLKPSIENYKLIEDEAIKIVTLAPELDERYELTRYLKSTGVRVSAGHCEASDLSQVEQVTHLYNAMGSFSHKEPSTVVSALSNNDVFVELIADFQHVREDVLKITLKIKPHNKIILISDALPITHSDKVSMEFCGKTVYLNEGKAVDDSGTMAGSTAFVSDIIRKLVKNGLMDLDTAVSMASSNIDFVPNIDAQIYWKNDLTISAMNFEGNLITF